MSDPSSVHQDSMSPLYLKDHIRDTRSAYVAVARSTGIIFDDERRDENTNYPQTMF